MIGRVIEQLFTQNLRDDTRTFVNQGGTSSGKTMTILFVLLYHAIKERGAVITIVGQDLPNLKVGAFRDCKTILANSPWLTKFFKVSESGHSITGQNGSILEFNSYDDAQDAKNGKRDYLFVNEANGVSYEIYWQLQIRTRKQVFIDYNPSERFWVHNEVIGREGVRLIISDHRGNPFLTEEEHQRIENISDPDLWEVYARGKTGKLKGLVLTNWDIVDTMPDRSEWKADLYGLDWGYVNDPTALVHICLVRGELYADGLIYRTGMTNADIAKEMRNIGLSRSDLVVADSAEMKSIAEVNANGFRLIPCTKGSSSVIQGIDVLKRYKIHVTRRSAGLRDELLAYKWERDRDGNLTNKPVDAFNHAIDAMRYAVAHRFGMTGGNHTRAHILRD